VKTDDGIIGICGDVFWKENYPEIDQICFGFEKIRHSRKLVLKMSNWIIPGPCGIYKIKDHMFWKREKSQKKRNSKLWKTARSAIGF